MNKMILIGVTVILAVTISATGLAKPVEAALAVKTKMIKADRRSPYGSVLLRNIPRLGDFTLKFKLRRLVDNTSMLQFLINGTSRTSISFFLFKDRVRINHRAQWLKNALNTSALTLPDKKPLDITITRKGEVVTFKLNDLPELNAGDDIELGELTNVFLVCHQQTKTKMNIRVSDISIVSGNTTYVEKNPPKTK